MRRSMSNPEFTKAKQQASNRIDNATPHINKKNVKLYIDLPILTTNSELHLLTPDDIDSVISPHNPATDKNPFAFFSPSHSPPKKTRTDDPLGKLIKESLNKN